MAAILLATPWAWTGPPADGHTQGQMQRINAVLDAMHEEVAATRRSWQPWLAVFVVTLFAPLLFAGWILVRAERSVVGHDEMIRALVRLGADLPVVRQYLREHDRPRLPAETKSEPEGLLGG